MEILLMLLSCFLWLHVRGETCPSLFQRYSQRHTYFLSPKITCNIQRNNITADDVNIILKEHNAYRSRVATGMETTYRLPKATNMLQMVWDDELASVAQKHADQCVFQHDCNECRRVKNFDVGQNLYERTTFPDPLKRDWKAAVKAWYDEVNYLNKAQIDRFQDGEGPPATGHLTQVIWAKTWRVGCGFTMYKRDKEYVELYTCNYGPAGNVIDESIYKKGDPCGGCPINSCCGKPCPSPSYNGLCQISGNKAPLYKRPGGSIFFCSFNNEQDCATKVSSGANKWEISNTLSGSYIGIVLNGGESSMLNFTTPFKGKKTMCLITYFRKGPNVDGKQDSSTALEIIRIPEIGFTFGPKLQGSSIDFIKFSVTLNWNMASMLSLSFSVPAGKPPQYLEMMDIEVREGQC